MKAKIIKLAFIVLLFVVGLASVTEAASTVAISAVSNQYMWIRYPDDAGTYWYGKKLFTLNSGTYLVQGNKPGGGWDSAELTVNSDGTISITNYTGNLHQFEKWEEALPKEAALIVYNGTNITINPQDNLKSTIEGAGNVTKITLNTGVFNVSDTITITDKRDIIIQGGGWDNTIVTFASDVYIGFKIHQNLETIVIKEMFIKGTLPLLINTHAIASTGAANNVKDTLYKRLKIEDVANGIGVGAGSDFDGATIIDNRIAHTQGDTSGWGYGIHNDNARNVLIANNYIEDTTRHGIYQARADTNITIENNFILNNNIRGEAHILAAGLVIARSNHVKVAYNIIMNTRTVGLSVEYDDVEGWNIDDVTLVNNRVIGAKYIGIWSNTGNTHAVLGNTVVRHPGTNYDNILLQPNPVTGNPTVFQVPNTRWENPDFVTSLKGYVHIMKNATLDRITPYLKGYVHVMKNVTLDGITPYTWTYTTSPSNWFNTQGLTGLEDARGAGAHRLYISQNAVMHEVDPETWGYIYDPVTNWHGTQFMAATSGYFHVMQNNILHRVTPGTFSYIYSPVNWFDTLAMDDWGGYLYILQNGDYHRVNPITLQYVVVGQ